MRKLLTLYTFCTVAFSSNCQDLAIMGVNTAWHKGKVVLSDGNEHAGMVSYNDKQAVISFRNEDLPKEEPSQLFRENEVISLHYFDTETGNPKKFYALVYNSTKKSNVDPNLSVMGHEMIVGSTYLFEIIKEFNDFAVVSRKNTVVPIYKKGSENAITNPINQTGSSTSTRQLLMQSERIYFMRPDGTFELYLSISQSDKDGLIFDSSKSKNVLQDKSLLEKYLQDHWNEIQEFMKFEHQNPKIKSNLLNILNYYEELRSQ